MSRRSKAASGAPAWRWQRSISREAEALWTERLGSEGELNWLIVERPQRARLIVEAFFSTQGPALALARKWGGRVERFKPTAPQPSAPMRVSDALEIAHDEEAHAGAGSADHSLRHGLWQRRTSHNADAAAGAGGEDRSRAERRVLDLGTGSGVLALAARKLGARRIAAGDFDPDAIRTARQNEALNFPRRAVRWQVADVRQLEERGAYSLVLANLFSGILVEAAKRIARAVAPGGELWLSGVLRSQQMEVAEAFRGRGCVSWTTSRAANG